MFDYTGVDGIMIGRATLGKPWEIGQIINILNEEYNIKNYDKEKLDIIKEHIKLAIEEKGEYIAVREMRKHICWYVKNMKDSSKIKERVNKIERIDELLTCLEEYFTNI